MILVMRGHDFFYEIESLCRLFYPYVKFEYTENQPEEEDFLLAVIERGADEDRYLAAARAGGEVRETEERAGKTGEKEEKRLLAALLFGILSDLTGKKPLWGILTGIHPVKTFRLLSEEIGEEAAARYFSERYFVSDEKISMARRTLSHQRKYLQAMDPKSFALYLSVPFCPTRCSYCSFVSQSVEKSRKLIPQYVKLLCRELSGTGKIARELSLNMTSVYLGGGTPTVLTAQELDEVLSAVRESFDFSSCGEFTVEAGRPDTITREKLRVMKSHGVNRISINPQSMNENVLRAIGRRHSAKEIIDAFYLAREEGFDNINMDLIIGLPEDTPESFSQTLSALVELYPENITVHALALKHAAQMMQDSDREYHKNEGVNEMAATSVSVLGEAGYEPYYLYRQSRMAGNLENIGWCRPGRECAYNIATMEEIESIIACGAGGVSKIIDFSRDLIRRVFNFKYSYEYVSRHDEIMARKEEVRDLFLAIGKNPDMFK